MKKRKNYLHLFLLLMGLLMLFGAGMTASAAWKGEVLIKGVKYRLFSDNTAMACIDEVRGDDLPTELYIPRKIKYKKVKYKVVEFCWGDRLSDKYMEWEPLDNNTTWKQNIVIPDKKRSYQACLKKITIAKGVKVYGPAYGYEKLRQVVLEDPNDLEQVLFNNCPKLRRLHIPKGLTYRFDCDIKNCPSLKVTIDKNNKHLKMVGNAIYRKDVSQLLNVTAGKKNYKVSKGTKYIGQNAFWGNTDIETLHLRSSMIEGIEGLPNLKRIKVNTKRDGSDKRYREFYWNRIAYCPSLRSIELPECIQYIYTYDYGLSNRIDDTTCFAPIKHVYLYSTNLKGGDLKDIPAKTTFHVRSKKVAKQLRKYKFKGKIVVEKNMK